MEKDVKYVVENGLTIFLKILLLFMFVVIYRLYRILENRVYNLQDMSRSVIYHLPQ